MSISSAIKGVLGLKTGIETVGRQVRELQATIEQLKRTREELQAAPRTRADLAAALDDWIAFARSDFLEGFGQSVAFLIRKPDRKLTPADARWSPLIPPGGQGHSLHPTAAVGLLAPLMRDALRQAVLDLPETMFAGAVPLEERKRRLAELDAEIEAGEAELAELRRAADSAGIMLR
jgi:hypothetical protein